MAQQPDPSSGLDDAQDLAGLLKQVGKLVKASQQGSALLVRPDGSSVAVPDDVYHVLEAIITAMGSRRSLIVEDPSEVFTNDMKKVAPAVFGDYSYYPRH